MKRGGKILLGVGVLGLLAGGVYLATKSASADTGGEEDFKLDPKVKDMIDAEKKAGEFVRVVGGVPTSYKITDTGHVINKETGQKAALVGHKKPGAS